MVVFLTQSLCKTYMNYSRMTVEPFAEKDPPSHHQVALPCNIIICRFQKRFRKKEEKKEKRKGEKVTTRLCCLCLATSLTQIPTWTLFRNMSF